METELDRWVVKLLCMAGLFLNQIIFILLPIKVSEFVRRRGKAGALLLSALSCFGGGVFFGAYLIHLQPEVRVILEEALLNPRGITYPVSELIAGLGFFLILFVEQLVLLLQGRSTRRKLEQRESKCSEGKMEEEEKEQEDHGIGGSGNRKENNVKRQSPVQIFSMKEATSGTGLAGNGFDNNGYTGDFNDGIAQLSYHSFTQGNNCDVITLSNGEKQPAISNGTTHSIEASGVEHLSEVSLGNAHPGSDGEAGIAIDNTALDAGAQAAMARSAIFIFALSLDSIFEGLSMGLKVTSQEVITLFVAIVSHEFIMSFCIGMEMVRYYSRRKMVAVGVMYAATPVLGAAVGTAIVETAGYGGNTAIDIANGILQAICAGAFMYCTFIGILGEELSKEQGMVKSLMALAGFAFMAGMGAMPDSPAEDFPANTTALPVVDTVLLP